MFVDPAQRVEIEMLIPGLNNARYVTMRCFVWLVRLTSAALIFTLFAGLIAGQLSGSIPRTEMPKTKPKT